MTRARSRARPQPPAGWRRRLARLPIGLYRVGLGSLFGKRLLLLRHTGLVTGAPREVCLEVVSHDPVRGSWTVASGFGTRAQWYRNLRHVPNATIQVGRTSYAVRAVFLSPDEGGRVMAAYGLGHLKATRTLCRYLALEADGGQESLLRAGREIPFVRLEEVPSRNLGAGPQDAGPGGDGTCHGSR